MTEYEIKLYEKIRYVTDETDKDDPVALLSFDLSDNKICEKECAVVFYSDRFLVIENGVRVRREEITESDKFESRVLYSSNRK